MREPGGTNLFGAVNLGMAELNQALAQRLTAALGSVVTTGTLVTITDGRDTAGERLQNLDPRFGSFLACGDCPATDAGPPPQSADDPWLFTGK